MPEPQPSFIERAPAPRQRESSVAKYVETFLQVDQQSRYGLQAIAAAARVLKSRYAEISSGKYNDIREVRRLMRHREYEFLSQALLDPAELKDALTALKIISVAKKTRRDLIDAIPTDVAHSVLTKFGLEERYNALINPNEDAGEFVHLRSTKIGTRLRRAARDDNGGLKTVFFEGITQDLKRTTVPHLQQMAYMGLPDAAVYAYSGVMNQLATEMGIVLAQRGSFGDQHRSVAAKLHYSTTSPTGDYSFDEGNAVAYSIGCFMWKGTQNALVHSLITEHTEQWKTPGIIENYLARKRALTVGVQPLWNVGGYLDEEFPILRHQSTPEITLYCVADMFSPTSRYSRGIICGMMARNKDLNLDTNFVIFRDPENANKIAVFIHPDALNITAGKIGGRVVTNLGAHDYHCYMASVGLQEGAQPVDRDGAKIGEIIKAFFSRELDLSRTTVAEAFTAQGFNVLELHKENFRSLYENGYRDEGYLAWEAGLARRITKEYLARGRHSLLEPKQPRSIELE